MYIYIYIYTYAKPFRMKAICPGVRVPACRSVASEYSRHIRRSPALRPREETRTYCIK